IWKASYVTVRNLILDGNDVQDHVVRIEGTASNIIITGNEIRKAGYNGFLIGSAPNVTILNNLIHDNSHSKPAGGHGYGCYCDAPGLVIEGNTFYNNARYAVHYYPGYNPGVIIRNNTFHDNNADQCGTDIIIYGNNHQIYNNVLYN